LVELARTIESLLKDERFDEAMALLPGWDYELSRLQHDAGAWLAGQQGIAG
jgi:hypothetical protein